MITHCDQCLKATILKATANQELHMIDTNTHTNTKRHIYTYKYENTHLHIQIQKYTHTYIYIQVQKLHQFDWRAH